MGASATKQTAVSVVPLSAVPICNAVWVFPMPPAPVSVTSLCSRTSRVTSSSSVSRPTKLVSESGKFEVRYRTPDPRYGTVSSARCSRRYGDRFELAALFVIEHQRAHEEREGCALRGAPIPPFERADSVRAHAGAFGERFLRESAAIR